jgi:hypothetical protein
MPGSRRVLALVVVPSAVVATGLLTLYLVVLPLFPAVGRYYFPQSTATYATYRLAIYGHIVSGGVALVLGPLVLWNALRRRPRHSRPAHRRLGTAYAVAVACAASFAAFMSFHAYAGTLPGGRAVVTSGFLTLSVVWLGTLAAAVHAMAVDRDLARHRFWMVVNVSVTYSAVWLRVVNGVLLATGTFERLYPVLGWAGWVPDVAVGFWLARRQLTRRQPARLVGS